jgi:hypothetical protein
MTRYCVKTAKESLEDFFSLVSKKWAFQWVMTTDFRTSRGGGQGGREWLVAGVLGKHRR